MFYQSENLTVVAEQVFRTQYNVFQQQCTSVFVPGPSKTINEFCVIDAGSLKTYSFVHVEFSVVTVEFSESNSSNAQHSFEILASPSSHARCG